MTAADSPEAGQSVADARAAVIDAIEQHYQDGACRVPIRVCPFIRAAIAALIAAVERQAQAAMPCYEQIADRYLDGGGRLPSATCRDVLLEDLWCPSCKARAEGG